MNAQFGELKSRITSEAGEFTEPWTQQIKTGSHGRPFLLEKEQIPVSHWNTVDYFCCRKKKKIAQVY